MLLLENSSCFSEGVLVLLGKSAKRHCLACLASLSAFVHLRYCLSRNPVVLPRWELTLCCFLLLPLGGMDEGSSNRTCATASTASSQSCPARLCHPCRIYNPDKTTAQGKLQLRLENIAGDDSELPAKDYTPRAALTS